MKHLLLSLLLCSVASAVTVARVGHPVGTPHSVTWSEANYEFTSVDGTLPSGMAVQVDGGDVTIDNPGETAGYHDITLSVSFDWIPFPSWAWLRIPRTVEVTVLWGVYPEPDDPFFDGLGDIIIMSDP